METIDAAEQKPKSTPFLNYLFGAPPTPGEPVVERYSKTVRVLHWVNAVAWVVLIVTGLFLFVPQFGDAAVGGLSRLFHRIGAVVMVGWALIYVVGDPRSTWAGIKDAFKWGKCDLGWLVAAIPYYFFGKEESTIRIRGFSRRIEMPPQHHMNTGQKLWWLFVLAGGALMIITGALMWFFKNLISPGAFMWSAFFHDVGFIILLVFAFVHVYLSVFHPKMRGIFWSMWGGTISAEYASSHHKKWYDDVTKGEGGEPTKGE